MFFNFANLQTPTFAESFTQLNLYHFWLNKCYMFYILKSKGITEDMSKGLADLEEK